MISLVLFWICSYSICLGKKDQPNILFVSRHFGTLEDFKYFSLRAFGKEPEHISPTNFNQPYGMTVEQARAVLNQYRPVFIQILQTHDILFLCDTVPDAVPFLMLKLTNPSAYGAKIVLQVANRFDFAVGSNGQEAMTQYREFMGTTVNHSDIRWIVNNPYEVKYMADRNVLLPYNTLIIRPFGYSDLSVLNVNIEETKELCLYAKKTPFDTHVIPAHVSSAHLKPVNGKYGGPHTLAKYKCLVQFPYQVSVMSMYENIAAGVVTLIPSLSFLQELLQTHADYNIHVRRGINAGPTRYVEYYNPRYHEFFIKFNGWAELNAIVALPYEQFRAKYNISRLVIEMQAAGRISREEQYEKMIILLSDLYPGFQATL